MGKAIPEILSFSGLRIGYAARRPGTTLLPPLTASARGGELIAVIGRNGIGKSTLLRTLAGLQPSLAGDITYSGKNSMEHSRNELARTIGYISTEIVKVSNMRVYDLVALGRFPYTDWFGRIDEENHRMITDAIAKTGLVSLTDRFITELSDGERQKAMIARILAQDTGIMVMDEPTAFLDIGSKFEILHLMHLLSLESGKTIIFSTHDLTVAMSQADKVWLILGDRMVEGAPEDLMLQGAFDHLFDSPAVHYNPDHGTYSFVSESRGDITVSGEGTFLHYTTKALNRAGYSVSRGTSRPCLSVPSGERQTWEYYGNAETFSFSSIYDLVSWMNCR